jgi:hypothetical protein
MGLQNTVWNPENELGTNNSQSKKTYTIASIESILLQKNFTITMEFRRQQVMTQQPNGIQIPQDQVTMRPIEQGWK